MLSSTSRRHGFEQRVNLQAQFIRHRWPVRFVGFEHFIPKRFPGSVEYHREMFGILFFRELQYHAEHAMYGAGRLATRTRKLG
jgi:hypothetical protein